MEGETYLDLNKVKLYGWERQKSDLVVDSFVRSVELGDEFSPVMVYQVDNNTYELTTLSDVPCLRRTDGGHTRAVAHYIDNKPLKVKIMGNVPKVSEGYFSIEELELIDDKDVLKDGTSWYEILKSQRPEMR
jgi:hypothetical protein